jgi:hypothetical protein
VVYQVGKRMATARVNGWGNCSTICTRESRDSFKEMLRVEME